jgi:hypothetical protein
MKRFAFVLLLLSASMVSSGSAHATAVVYDFGKALRILSGSTTVPPEWDGIWTHQDSVYDCTTGFKYVSSSSDTLCSGQVYTQDPGGSGVTFDCTGTADATTIHVTCTGSAVVVPDSCQVTFVIQFDATRTSNSYRSVTTVNATYSGTGLVCSLLPATCTRIVAYGTRTGPAPAEYCLTPATRTTWGHIKTLYR